MKPLLFQRKKRTMRKNPRKKRNSNKENVDVDLDIKYTREIR